MLTLRTVNRELQKTVPDFDLIRGEGYFYVCGPGCESWESTMIYTYRVNNLTLKQWIESCESLITAGAKHINRWRLE